MNHPIFYISDNIIIDNEIWWYYNGQDYDIMTLE